MRCREHPPKHTHLSVPGFKPRTCPPRHKLRYHVENLRSLLDLFPWKNTVTTNTADSCKSFSLSLSQNSHGVRQSSHASVETNSNKRISVLGTNHTKIYRVNLVGFKHSTEDPSRSPHHQNKSTLRSKRFSKVLSKHQGRFLETVPEAKHSQTELPITSDYAHDLTQIQGTPASSCKPGRDILSDFTFCAHCYKLFHSRTEL